ncbi:YoaK family protein [Chitinophaga sp. HK235]|uniref:YoaK family protein n=1 Tax=Chitinophaga sp. HK235 TaxID=2952571 RepID=UPI001BADBA7B|nr:YoaK family protein [Chitinophaga sp. HK235]
MTEQKHSINWVTFLLAWVAGYCDTATFVSGDSIFSAHVTGNFIVFAAQVSSGSTSATAWIKLITFPVFVIAVMAGGWLVEKSPKKYRILLIEGIILTFCGLAAFLLPILTTWEEKLVTYLIVMITVLGMGLQNAFGKLFSKETHGPTTMMTGNVTQAALDLGNIIRKGIPGNEISLSSLYKQLVTIGGFLAGCIIGALLSRWVGLSAMMIPGVAIMACYLQGETAAQKSEG